MKAAFSLFNCAAMKPALAHRSESGAVMKAAQG